MILTPQILQSRALAIASYLNYLSIHLSLGNCVKRADMKLFFLLTGLITIRAGVIKEESECDGVKIKGVYYDSEVIRKDLDRPYFLVVDNSTNNLYFSYNVKEDEDQFKSARLNLNTKEFNNIDGVTNGFAQTVNPVTYEIYIGGSDGIYKYDNGTNNAQLIGEKDTDIWVLYFKDVLYFSVFPAQFLYTFIDGETRRFPDLEDTKVDSFVIDKENDMFYTNATGLYSQKKGTKDAVLYQGSVVLRSLTTDRNGNVYACLQDGIYAVNKSSKTLEKVVDVDDGFGMAFDKDNNIVYSDATRIVRLKANKHKKC